jgi:hypothetical protein
MFSPAICRGEMTTIEIESRMAPPYWALLERQLLARNAEACEEFYQRYFDERGYLLCVERWGGDDGPDDAIENCNDWPLLHALGSSDVVLRMYKQAWEGHLRQYTEAKTVEVPLARDGMYYKEFPTTFDWLHNGEGLTVFNLQGLSDPTDRKFGRRVRRYAGFYMNEDPGAANYDPKHKIIRSLFNGSRGPLLRKATGLDWAGDPIEIKNRFRLGHGEESYEQMVAHFKDYNDIIGDHPQNLLATSLALNAYLLTGEPKYRLWLLEYVEAWHKHMLDNDNIIPTNIGLDGKIGSAADGKWYGGVYGWGFTVVVPQDGSLAHRNTHHLGLTGFVNAYLLTGEDRYLEPWRRQIDKINAQGKKIDGFMQYPRMYGDKGWYDYRPAKYDYGAVDIWYLSMQHADLQRLNIGSYRVPGTQAKNHPWISYLLGQNPEFPVRALLGDLARMQARVEAMRADTTTPDTRLADDPMQMNPASVGSLIQLMLGGLHPKHQGNVLQCRLRYFDPVKRRAGIPQDVAALVDHLAADEVAVTLVNLNPLQSRTVIVQAGGYGEHQIVGLILDDFRTKKLDARRIQVRLAAGAGKRLVFKMRRYVNQPTMSHPWD